MKKYSIDLPKRLILAISLAALPGATALFSSTAIADDKEQANLSYNVYIGASKMFKIGFKTTLTEQSYRSYMKLKPKGLAKLFANVTMVMNTEGTVQKNSIQPTKFSFYRKSKKRKRTSNVTWTQPDIPSTNRTYKVSSRKQADLAKTISSGMPDPLSAFLRLGITDAKAPCSKAQRVYDGGKVYDLKFKLLKKVAYRAKVKNSYKGPAFKCQLSHKPVAGYSKKDLAKSAQNPVNFTIWFAPVKSALLKKSILLPIAAIGKVKGRAFSAFSNKATFAGKAL